MSTILTFESTKFDVVDIQIDADMQPTPSQRVALLKQRKKYIREIIRSASQGVRQALHDQVAQISQMLGMESPSLASLTQPSTK